nr:ABC transporter ATP-binding protein [Bacillota bacterium]
MEKKKALIELIDVTKTYDEENVVNNINLTIYENEFVTLLGPSGCGKTTTLRMIAGFVQPDQGSVIINGKLFNDLPPYARPIHTVFQRYALFPHLNVFDNVAFGLNNRSWDYLQNFFGKDKVLAEAKKIAGNEEPKQSVIKKVIKQKIEVAVKDALKLVKLNGFENRKIDQIS